MPTANERRALWFLAAVALSGSVVRIVGSRAAAPGSDPALQRQIGRVDSVRDARPDRKGRSRTESRPASGAGRAARAAPVDLNAADVAELEALPGIGPTLAARIIAARDSLRGFVGLDGLCGVRGVGPALLERLRPLVTVGGERPAANAQCPASLRAAPKAAAARRPKPR